MERVVRRAALSTAVAASHLAEGTETPREEAYTLGLLEPLGCYELLKLLISVPFPPGPIRIGALSRFRAAAGRVLARKLNLPQAVEDVLGSSGRVASRSPAAEQLIFLAKQIAPSEQIGHEWTTRGSEALGPGRRALRPRRAPRARRPGRVDAARDPAALTSSPSR